MTTHSCEVWTSARSKMRLFIISSCDYDNSKSGHGVLRFSLSAIGPVCCLLCNDIFKCIQLRDYASVHNWWPTTATARQSMTNGFHPSAIFHCPNLIIIYPQDHGSICSPHKLSESQATKTMMKLLFSVLKQITGIKTTTTTIKNVIFYTNPQLVKNLT